MRLEREIEQYAYANGFIVGFCDAEKLEYLEGLVFETPFVRFSQEQRITPRLCMPSAKSVIVAGAGYGKRKRYDDDDAERGSFSMSAVGTDYHVRVKKMLENLRAFMLEHVSFDSVIQVDTGPLIEREFAKKAGIAWQGKNGNVYSNAFGSLFNIGIMVTSLELRHNSPSPPAFSLCGDCNICVRACPGGAIKNDGAGFDYKSCVSYLTQKKGALSAAEQALIGKSLYGCDICQKVCRYNIDKSVADITKIDGIKPLLSDFISMTETDFADRYGETAIFWRGLGVLKRNAGYAMNNIRKKGDT